MHTDRTRFGGRAVVATAAFFIVSAIEIARLVMGRAWGSELSFAGSNVGLVLVPFYVASAIGLVARKAWAWPLVLLSALSLLGHAGIVGISGAQLPCLLYLILGFAAIGSIVRHLATYGVKGYDEEVVVVRRREPLFRPSYR
jgi:hypothetical protein